MSKSLASPEHKPIPEAQKFISDMVWITAYQIMAELAGFIILPALTKSYSAEIYGVWVQTSVTVGLIAPFLSLHLGTAIVRFLSAETSIEQRRKAFGTMLWPIVAFICLILIISLLFGQNLAMFLFSTTEYAYLIPLAFLWASMNALFSFSISYLRARGKIKKLSIIQFSFVIIQMIIIVVIAIQQHDLGWTISSIIISEFIFIAFVFRIIIKEIGIPKPSFEGLKGYLNFSIPQLPSGVLLWVISASDRYFITHMLNLSQTGIYSASYALGSVIGFFYQPITFVLFPAISSLWDRNKTSTVRVYLEYSTKLFLLLAIPGAAGLYILSQPILRIFTTSNYVIEGSIILLIAIGAILHGIYQINVYIVLMVNKTKWLPLMIAIAAIINAGLNLALIPRVGIIGAAISTIVSYFVLAAIVTIWARTVLSYKIDIKFLSKVTFSALLMALILSFFKISDILGLILAILAGIIIFALLLFLFKAFQKNDIELFKKTLNSLKYQRHL